MVATRVDRFPNLDAATAIATGFYKLTLDNWTTRVINRQTNLEICRFPQAGRTSIDFTYAGTPA